MENIIDDSIGISLFCRRMRIMCFSSDILLGKISGFSSQGIRIHIMFRSFYSKKNQNSVGIFVQILISLSRWKRQKCVFKIKNSKPSQYKMFSTFLNTFFRLPRSNRSMIPEYYALWLSSSIHILISQNKSSRLLVVSLYHFRQMVE